SWIHHTILGSSNWTIIEDVMGLRPRSDAKVELWPIDIGWDHFTVDNLRYRNVDLSIVWDRPGDGTVHYPGVPEGYSIFVDGKRRVTVDALVHTVWDPARREVTFPEGGGTTLFTADGRRPKAPTEHRLSGERIKDLFQKAGLDLDGAGPDLVREATASHGDPDGAVDGFTINEPHWSSKGSGRPRDWVEVDLGGARRVDTVRLYFYNDRAVNGHSEPALYTVQYLDGGTWREVPRQAKSPVYPRANLNEVRFPAIKTDRLRILVTHRKGYATGLKEIQVFSTGERPPAARNHAPYALVVQDPSYTRPAQARLNAVS